REWPGPDRVLADHVLDRHRRAGDADRSWKPGAKHLLQYPGRRRQRLGLSTSSAGFPITTAPAATSAVTSDPQRTTAPSPTDTPLRMVALPWIQAWRPMRMGRRLADSPGRRRAGPMA